MRLPVPILVLLLACLTVGCGSNSSESTNVFGGTPPSGASYQGFILGRVVLNQPLSQGKVEIELPTGQSLLSFQTDKVGYFQGRGALPADFTVRSGGWKSEVRGGWKGGTLQVNAGTTLVSYYLKAHPGLSLPEAERKVHDFLHLPPAYQVQWISTVPTRVLNPSVFFQGAQAAGGVENYMSSLVTSIDSPPRLAFLAQDLTDLSKKALDALFGDGVTDATGWALGKMKINIGTAGALSTIEGELDDVSTQLSMVISDINDDYAYETLDIAQSGISNAVANITTNTSNLTTAISSYLNSNTPVNVPVASNPTVANAIATSQSLGYQQSVLQIENALLGLDTTNLINAYTNTTSAGVNITDANYGGYACRNNKLTKQISQFTVSYLNPLGQGINLVAETAHSQLPYAEAIGNAGRYAQGVTANMTLTSQQVPDPLASDEVFLDIGNGLMWYAVFMTPTDFLSASSAAASLQVGPYSGFALPTQDQINTLIESRVISSCSNPTLSAATNDWSNSNTTNWTNAFNTLGFNTSNYDQASGNDEGSWMVGPEKVGGLADNIYYWNGTNKNPSTSAINDEDMSSYLVCRPYPGNAEASPSPGNFTIAQGQAAYSETEDENFPSPFGNALVSSFDSLTATSGRDALVPLINFVGFGQSYNARFRVAWTSSNSTAATISNLAPPAPSPNQFSPLPSPLPSAPTGPIRPLGPPGHITWHPSLTGAALPNVTFTAQFQGFQSPTSFISFFKSITLAPPPGLIPQLTSLQVAPLNQQYDLASVQNLTVNCIATAFYQDGQVADVSTDANTTWTLRDAQGNVVNSSTTGGFGVNQGALKNQLTLTSNTPTTLVNITAVYNGPWGSRTNGGNLGLILPAAAPSPSPSGTAPVVLTLSPTTGPAGTAVTIKGQNLSGVTNVTFGGVNASFFTSSNIELTATVPNLPSAGTVPVVLTNGQGLTGQSNFGYTVP